MSQDQDVVNEPVAISKIAGRFLLFDINVVTYLRRAHHICGVLIGSIPQIPQQNVFLGLPVELLPEEAKLLVEKDAAYIIDDSQWQKERFRTLSGTDRSSYLDSLRTESRKAQRRAEGTAEKRAEHGLAKQNLLRGSRTTDSSSKGQAPDTRAAAPDSEWDIVDDSLSSSPALPYMPPSSTPRRFTITPTASDLPSTLPVHESKFQQPAVPKSYPLFAHLHARRYFITPGIRFGCDYTVYPGDPLRFHSHFLAVGYAWSEEFNLMDLVGGGRLGTGVKKGFLIGGVSPTISHENNQDDVRTFCIEWGGM